MFYSFRDAFRPFLFQFVLMCLMVLSEKQQMQRCSVSLQLFSEDCRDSLFRPRESLVVRPQHFLSVHLPECGAQRGETCANL